MQENPSAYEQLDDYYSSHNYGQQNYSEYSTDPEWQELNNNYLQELGREPVDYENNVIPDISDIHDELTAFGIPEGSPELEAILLNEQAGIDEIKQAYDYPIDDFQSDTDETAEILEQADVDNGITEQYDANEISEISEQVDVDNEINEQDDTDEGNDSSAPTRDVSEQWEIGNRAIDDNVEAMRDDLRDKGLEDGPEMESIVMTERLRMQEELERNIRGDFSEPYKKPDFDELLNTSQEEDMPSVMDVPDEINYDEVFEGLDEYDFDGIDYAEDAGRLDTSLESFDSSTWEGLTLDEQKNALTELADYVKDAIGLDDPPEIVFYNEPDNCYGGYLPGSNTLQINEYMLGNNEEAADTVAHELWHAYQHQRASNPQSAKDYQYQYGFDNYISAEDDFTGYQEQLVEAEARAFAQQFKDRLNNIKGRRI